MFRVEIHFFKFGTVVVFVVFAAAAAAVVFVVALTFDLGGLDTGSFSIIITRQQINEKQNPVGH